jgi:hypothetical protein
MEMIRSSFLRTREKRRNCEEGVWGGKRSCTVKMYIY